MSPLYWRNPWAKFRARTAAGVWWEYERMPLRGAQNWRTNGGRAARVCVDPAPSGAVSELEQRTEHDAAAIVAPWQYDWAKYRAQDADGAVWEFEVKPFYSDHYGEWLISTDEHPSGGDAELLRTDEPPAHPENTLEERKCLK